PVKDGLVASLSRPGGNVTGITLFFGELVAKRLELLRELVPGARVIAVLNPNNPNAEARSKALRAAARAIGLQIHLVNATNENETPLAHFRQGGGKAPPQGRRSFLRKPAPPPHHMGRAPCAPSFLRSPPVRHRRRPGELRNELRGNLSSGWLLRRQDSQWRET